ncbi:MAG: RidA family protein [Acidobacteria bacterium]|nr:RidA family protein [Acidobacteriota bacterium]
MLIANPKGNYSFVQGIAPYSAGAVAEPGFEIVHVRFQQPIPLAQGFERVKAHLTSRQRPLQALCGMELRSPKPFTFQGFADFNASYINVLKGWDIFLGPTNPVARTNIAPEMGAPPVPSLYGFSYTLASPRREKTFVVAGAGELPEGSLDPHDVVRAGQTTPEALREKARYVMGLMTGRLKGLGVGWDQVSVTEVYTVHPICSFLAQEIVRPMGASQIHGVTWHYARPPIVSIEFEMDLRGCRQELVL